MNAVRVRLVLFAVVGAVAVAYAGARYARLTDLVYSPTYEVTVELAATGGLFEGAEVTYRGVPVGRVEQVDLTADSVRAVISVGNDHEIPAEVDAAVHNRSAVGEQYLDLRPRPGPDGVLDAARLADGDVIPMSATSLPLPDETLLTNANRFVTTVDRAALRTVVDELGTAFDGADTDLRRILDGSEELLARADASVAATRSLIRDAVPVLGTQAQAGHEVRDFTRNLRLLSDTLAENDRALRRVIRDGGPAADEAAALVRGLAPLTPPFLANTLPVVGVVGGRLDGLEQALVAFPYSLAAAQAGVRNGQAQFSLALSPVPPACQVGYIPPSAWRSTQDLSVAPPRYDLRCLEQATNYRGSAYAPR